MQLDLFGSAPVPAGGVSPALVGEDLARIAATLPRGVHLGTSSWAFPGWAGLVWRDRHGEALLARRGLAAYAQHPLLRTVGVDRTHYQPVDRAQLAAWRADVPDGFRFLVKAHEACTLAIWPTHARYGANRGAGNPRFLDPAYARDEVIGPFVDGLGAACGPLLFQFAAQPIEPLGGSPRRFAEKLYRFLRDLPRGPLYAVEVRNASLLTPDYAAALRAAGAVHCLAITPGMPPPIAQWKLAGASDHPALVARWLLAPHHDYESAKAAYAPFDRLVDPDPSTRAQLATLVTDAMRRDVPAWIIANNKAEGSSPLTLAALARDLVDGSEPPF
ncbi:MAG TPA: DUF72 domain-containing protein [Kofleriaceae bacterium]|nr:DUF72 domain-containing protein [Kofleriaceae bacterium]